MSAHAAVSARPRTTFSVIAQTREESDAVLAFNDRMRAAQAPADFLLPDQPNNSHTLGESPRPIEWTKFVVVDSDDEVHGGFLLMTQPGWLDGELVPVANYQAPLSEALADSRYGLVGMHMLRFVQKHWPFTFAVGMGHADRPLPRLLRAAGWRIRSVPFLFHIVRASRVLRELRVLHESTARRLAARAGALTGAGAIGVAALQHRAWRPNAASDLQLERVDRWGDWADWLWAERRGSTIFSVIRDRATLECLYPLADERYLAFVARRHNDVVGWAVALNTQMREHLHFGNLRVATVLDAIALPGESARLAAQLRRILVADGADLIVTNQSHEQWVDAFRRAGFLSGPSNYLCAMSTLLSEAVGDRFDGVHVTRGDGDGRIHL
ncbi:MAG TPA: hypothetical protein VLV86_04960 [Vicinamibacterales bacterium]|nr:hypothetical protein [Vicinamibacterales bacterium]